MQTLKNNFSTVKRKGFLLYSLDLQLSSSESLDHVCSDIPTQLTEAHHCNLQNECTLMWRNRDFKKQPSTWHAYQKDTDQALLQGTASHWWAKIKIQTSSYRVQQQTSALIKQQCSLPLNALQWRVCFSAAASHTLQIDVNWHPSVCRKKREPLAKEINSCSSILWFIAHTGPHKHCQIILCGPTLYFSSICAADIQEFCSCLAMT